MPAPSSKTNALALIGVTLLAAGAGWFTRKALAPSTDQSTASAPASIQADAANPIIFPDELEPEFPALNDPSADPLPTTRSARAAEYLRLHRSHRLEDHIRALRIAEHMSAREIEQLVSQNDDLPEALYQRWAELDPAGIIQALQANPNNYHLRNGLFNYLANRDPDAALAVLDQLQGKAREQAEGSLLSTLAVDQPDFLLEIIRQDNPLQKDLWGYRTLGGTLFKQQPGAAQAIINSLPEGQTKELVWAGYLDAVAQNDPSRAIVIAGTLPEQTIPPWVRAGFYKTWLSQDSDAALDALAALPASNDKTRILQYLSQSAPTHDPAQTVAQFQQLLDGAAYDQFISQYMYQAVKKDPAAAALALDQMPYGEAYESAMRQVADHWSGDDPQAAMQWLMAQPAGPERDGAQLAVVQNFSRLQPEEAVAYVMQLPPEERTHELLQKLGAGLRANNLETASKLLATIDNPDAQKAIQAGIVDDWMMYEPAAAWDYAVANEISLDYNARMSLAYDWAKRNPQQAAKWATSLDDKNQWEGPIYNTMEHWTRHSPDEAGAWALKLPEGPKRDQALRSASDTARDYYPDTAFAYAIAIGDSEQRRGHAKRALEDWAKEDPEAAEQALRRSTLHIDEINQLLKEVIQ